jgi:hypothetical protein
VIALVIALPDLAGLSPGQASFHQRSLISGFRRLLSSFLVKSENGIDQSFKKRFLKQRG